MDYLHLQVHRNYRRLKKTSIRFEIRFDAMLFLLCLLAYFPLSLHGKTGMRFCLQKSCVCVRFLADGKFLDYRIFPGILFDYFHYHVDRSKYKKYIHIFTKCNCVVVFFNYRDNIFPVISFNCSSIFNEKVAIS